MGQIDIEVIAAGRVLEEGRGSLPFALVHGEALVAAAVWALVEARVLVLDPRTSIEDVVDSGLADGRPLVLHDSLCPMTPPEFIADCVRRAVEGDVAVVGVHGVTDTVKVLDGGRLGETLDRETLAKVTSPLVVPLGVAAQAADLLGQPDADLASVVSVLRRQTAVVLVEAPPEAMRVSGQDDVRVLEALTRPA